MKMRSTALKYHSYSQRERLSFTMFFLSATNHVYQTWFFLILVYYIVYCYTLQDINIRHAALNIALTNSLNFQSSDKLENAGVKLAVKIPFRQCKWFGQNIEKSDSCANVSTDLTRDQPELQPPQNIVKKIGLNHVLKKIVARIIVPQNDLFFYLR